MSFWRERRKWTPQLWNFFNCFTLWSMRCPLYNLSDLYDIITYLHTAQWLHRPWVKHVWTFRHCRRVLSIILWSMRCSPYCPIDGVNIDHILYDIKFRCAVWLSLWRLKNAPSTNCIIGRQLDIDGLLLILLLAQYWDNETYWVPAAVAQSSTEIGMLNLKKKQQRFFSRFSSKWDTFERALKTVHHQK